jgi:phenylacetate-CoA ligase
MNTAYRLYSATPVWVQNLLLSAYGVHLNALRYGSQQRAFCAELISSERLPHQDVIRNQTALLRQTWMHAARSVPWYRDTGLATPTERFEDQFLNLPLLTKSHVRDAGRSLVSAEYQGDRLVEIHTGGTTGTPLAVYCDKSTLQRNYAFFQRFKLWAGVSAGERVATFAGRPIIPVGGRSPYWRFNYASNSALFSSYHIGPDTVQGYTEALRDYQPSLIDSYPSSIEPLARHLLATGVIGPRPKAIITSSETLHADVRALIESAFHCSVFDHYGAAEMAAFITQCEFGTYHVNPEFGLVELLDDSGAPVGVGERGQIVATGFINRVMPLIRYATGDFAVRSDDAPCACGRAFPAIARLEGRDDDVVVTPEGSRVGRLDPIFKSVAGIFETRIVQDAINHLRVEIVAPNGLEERDTTELLHQLRIRVGPSMLIDVVRVDAIPRTGRGKLRTVVNTIATK